VRTPPHAVLERSNSAQVVRAVGVVGKQDIGHTTIENEASARFRWWCGQWWWQEVFATLLPPKTSVAGVEIWSVGSRK